MRLLMFLLTFLMASTAQAQFSGGGGGSSPADKPVSLERLTQLCDAGGAEACGDLGGRYLLGKDVAKDLNKAAALFHRACDAGDARSCFDLGESYRFGEGVAKDQVKAASLYQRACEGREPEGCIELAIGYSQGNGVPKDDGKAALYADRACALKNQLGCAVLGLAYSEGVAGYSKDAKRAEDLLFNACFKGAKYDQKPDAASNVACPALTKLKGEPSCMSFSVVGSPTGEVRRHCHDEKAGWVTTVTQDSSASVPTSPAPVDNAVANQVAAATAIASGYTALNGKDYATALAQFAKACDAGSPAACGELGAMYFKGTGVTRNGARAAAPLAKACDGGQITSCGQLAVLYDNGDGVGANKALAFRLYSSACAKADLASCHGLGRLHERGQGTAANLAQAATLYQQSCNGGFADGCASIGSMYANGAYFAKSESQALSFFNRACSIGSASGCEQASRAQAAMNRSAELAFAKAAANMPSRVTGSPPCAKANQFGETDLATAEQYARQGIKQNDPYCMHMMGWVNENRGDYELAYAYYIAAANKNIAYSVSNIGGFYHNGHYVQRDYRTAISWYERALQIAQSEGRWQFAETVKRHIEGSKLALNPPPPQQVYCRQVYVGVHMGQEIVEEECS